MALEGSLGTGALVEVLRSLQRQGVTGILTVQGEAEIIAFSLLQGEIVSADALNQSLEDGLGEVLVREGLIEGDDFAGLVAEYQAGGGRVTELLLERSFLSRDQLLGALRRQTYSLCRQALTWKKGEYRFYQGDDVAYEAGVVPLGVDELLVRASDELGAAGPFGERVAVEGECYSSTLGPDSGAQLPKPVLDEERAEAEELYRSLDGERTLATLANDTGLSLFAARSLVSYWLECGLVETRKRPPVVESLEVPVELPAPVSVPMPQLPPDVSESPVADLGLDAILPSTEELSATILEFEPEVPPPASVPRPASAPLRETAKKSISSWPARIMGVGLFAAVLVVLLVLPARLLLPFPWQGGLRDAFDSERQALTLLKIDRAATSFFLLEGRYPEDLSLLVADRLIAPEALLGPDGKRLEYVAGPASYLVHRSGETSSEGLAGTIGENFLLDPQFAALEESSIPPLVLLD